MKKTDNLKDYNRMIEENKSLKAEISLLKKDNEILQKDYYNQIIINEFLKLDDYIDNVEDLLYNLFRTLEDIIDVDFIGLTLYPLDVTYFGFFRSLDNNTFNKIRKNHVQIIKEQEKINTEFTEKKLYINSEEKVASDNEVFSTIVHKISRHGKPQGLITFYMFNKVNMNQRTNLIKLFMPHVTTLIENAILFENQKTTGKELRKKLSAFSTLYKLSRTQTNFKKFDTVLKKILKAMVDEFFGVGGSLLFIDSGKDELYVKTYVGLQQNTAKNFRMKIGQGIVGKIAREGKAMIIVDNKYKKIINKKIKGANVFFWDFEKEYKDVRKNIISAISCPLKLNDEVLGVVSITSNRHIYNEEDLQLLEVFSSNIAYLSKNYSLYNNLESRLDELEIVNQLMKQVSVNTNLREIINLIFRILTDKFDFKTAAVILDNFPELKINYYSEFDLSDTNIEKIEKELLTDVKELLPNKLYAYRVDRNIIKKGNRRFTLNDKFTFASVPIIIKKKIYGFISIIQKKEKYGEKNLRFLSTIASAFSILLENIMVYENLEKKVTSLSTIFEVTKNIAEKLDYSEVAQELTENAQKILDSNLVVLRVFNEEESNLEVYKIAYNGNDDTNFAKNEILDSVELPFAREAFMKQKSVYVGKLFEKLKIKNFQWLVKNDLKGIFCIPLVIRNKAIAVLVCYIKDSIFETSEELGIVENMCSQAAIALENSKLFANLEKTYFDTIAALAAAIDAKDHYTHGHSEKVMEYSVSIAEELNLSEEEITGVKFAGLLHDIGKIGIDDTILKKNGILTSEERVEIEQHPVYGTRIVEKIDFLKQVSKLTYHHHERWDGKGYPDGLKGEEIPIGSRILSVADTFDAMTSNRSYRKALPEEIAVEEIKRCSGNQFDPKVVKAFLTVFGRKMRIKKMKILRTEKMENLRKN